jgi:hypothetical protein
VLVYSNCQDKAAMFAVEGREIGSAAAESQTKRSLGDNHVLLSISSAAIAFEGMKTTDQYSRQIPQHKLGNSAYPRFLLAREKRSELTRDYGAGCDPGGALFCCGVASCAREIQHSTAPAKIPVKSVS